MKNLPKNETILSPGYKNSELKFILFYSPDLFIVKRRKKQLLGEENQLF
jgi:hypothetical protein